jgi:hypothetical protein
MIAHRSVVAATRFAACASLIIASRSAAQSTPVDEGTFVITRTGASPETESFRILRLDGGMLRATGQLIDGGRRVTSMLTTDSLGTPLEYQVKVRENGVQTIGVAAMASAGRLSSRTQLQHGDESMREYPVATGSIILEDDLLHETYFVALGHRSGAVRVINPRTARGSTVTIAALGLEPLAIGGRQVTATHYSITGGAVRRDFWLDSAGRLLQVEIPSAGLKAVREEAPR